MGGSQQDLCIKCNKGSKLLVSSDGECPIANEGSKLLVCSDSECPIAVHEECMGCPARFDDTGNFYCPYCLYKQAITKSHKAREDVTAKKKALSTFIDGEMMDSYKWKQTISTAEGKEQTEVGVAENVEQSNFNDIDDGLENNDVSENSIRLAEDKEEEFNPECGSVSPCGGGDGSSLDKQNDIPLIREGDTSKFKGSDHCQLVEDKSDSLPIIVCGRDDMSCEEETTHQFEVVGVQERVQEQLPGQVDKQKIHRDIEYHQENSHLSGSHIVEGKTTKKTRDDLETDEKDGSSSSEEENKPIREDEATSISDEDDSISDAHSESRRRDKTNDKIRKDMPTVSRRSKRTQSPNIDLSRRSSPRLRTNPSKLQKTNASSKLRKLDESLSKSLRNSFPQGRRKKLPWTEDEEEMLKEGVQKFSSTANQNIPWMKILEFGQHVFDSTRKPGDLKDKWRNMLGG